MSTNPPLDKSSLVNHKLHIILSIISFGIWLPIYAAYYLFCRLTGSTIEQRRSIRVRAKKDSGITKNLIKESARKGYTYKKSNGYKKGTWISSQNYTLACGHQISARKQVGMFSKGLLNQTVRCEICNSDRTVTGTLYNYDNK